jgi:hypothetical protein
MQRFILLVTCCCVAALPTQSKAPADDGMSLTIAVSPPEVAIGQPLTLQYALKNDSEHSVSACVDGWVNYSIRGTERSSSEAEVSTGSPTVDKHFTLPPQTSLLWNKEIAAPDVGLGPARLIATVMIICRPAVLLQSKAVSFTVLPRQR